MTVLYLKYRPQKLDEIVGQGPIVTILSNAILQNKLSNAYLFQGQRGTGKTSTARIFARTINCVSRNGLVLCGRCEPCKKFEEDYIEIDAATNRGIKDVRELLEQLHYRPKYVTKRVIVIDECHQLTADAIGALLKIVEEPPSHIIFIFCTTQPILLTIDATKQEEALKVLSSRCMNLLFKSIEPDIIRNHLGWICEREGHVIPRDVLLAITRNAHGSLRDAESLLDAVFIGWSKAPSIESIRWLFPPEEDAAIQLLDDIASPNPYTSLSRMSIYNDGGLFIQLLIRHQLEFLSDALNLKFNLPIIRPPEMEARIQYLANCLDTSEITTMMKILGRIRGDTPLDMELGLIDIIQYLEVDHLQPSVEDTSKNMTPTEAPPLRW